MMRRARGIYDVAAVKCRIPHRPKAPTRNAYLSSKFPELVDRVMATPLVHAGTVTKPLGVTPQAARRIVSELGLRQMTGRGRFRAWGIV